MTHSTNRYLFTLSKFGSDSDEIATPLVLANAALASGADVLLWLTMDGVELAKQGAVDHLEPRSFAPVKELLGNYIENGGRIGVCPPCGKTHGVTEDNMVSNSTWLGAVALLEDSRGRQPLSF